MLPYKMNICQKLHEGDFERGVAFCEWFLQKHADNSNFNLTLIMSAEAHFELNRCVNKQNICFWAEENPKETTEISLHSERVTVWCGIHEHRFIVPFFFKDGIGQTVIVNGQRYNDIINDFLIPKVNVIDSYFQQDGATCHITRLNMEILHQTFLRRLISRFGDVEWPARSPYLSLLHYFSLDISRERFTATNQQILPN